MRRLHELEQRHQKLSMAVYEPWARPKHHFRMHISCQGHSLGLLLSTEAGEAKHHEYKGALSEYTAHLSDKKQLAFSAASRMLNAQVERAAACSPFHGYLADSARSDAKVLQRVPRLDGSARGVAPQRALAARTTAGMSVAAGDVVMCAPLRPDGAAVIVECWLDGSLQFLVEPLKLASCLQCHA